MISKVEIQKVDTADEFYVNVGRIRVGWMHLQIGTSAKNIYYDVSYVTDALNELLSASLFLFTSLPQYKKHYRFEKDNTIITHDLEGGSIDWYILLKNNVLQILIWEDINPELLDLLHAHGLECDPIIYEDHDLSTDLLFALEMTPCTFGQIIRNAFDQIAEKMNSDLYAKEWGYPFPIEDLKTLNNILKVAII